LIKQWVDSHAFTGVALIVSGFAFGKKDGRKVYRTKNKNLKPRLFFFSSPIYKRPIGAYLYIFSAHSQGKNIRMYRNNRTGEHPGETAGKSAVKNRFKP